MYNRYIAGAEPHRERVQSVSEGQSWFRRLGDSFPLFGGESKNAGIAGILKGFGLEQLDSGDVLLLLILLLVFLEGDNTELVITLGLMLLLGGED